MSSRQYCGCRNREGVIKAIPPLPPRNAPSLQRRRAPGVHDTWAGAAPSIGRNTDVSTSGHAADPAHLTPLAGVPASGTRSCGSASRAWTRSSWGCRPGLTASRVVLSTAVTALRASPSSTCDCSATRRMSSGTWSVWPSWVGGLRGPLGSGGSGSDEPVVLHGPSSWELECMASVRSKAADPGRALPETCRSLPAVSAGIPDVPGECRPPRAEDGQLCRRRRAA
jgi:hypothetical protein